MYNFEFSKKFKKSYLKLTSQEQKQVDDKLRMLSFNPSHPSLRAKKIKKSDNLFESSVNMDIRIVWCFEENNNIYLIDIGHHKIIDKF